MHAYITYKHISVEIQRCECLRACVYAYTLTILHGHIHIHTGHWFIPYDAIGEYTCSPYIRSLYEEHQAIVSVQGCYTCKRITSPPPGGGHEIGGDPP